ncbi:MAG: hypothetical protein Q9166_000896 [cf. Caloplaca sp. 2 TL-2023]
MSSNPPPPPTSVIVSTSTNSQGSVIVSSFTSTAAVPTYSAACGGSYLDNLGYEWIVQCNTAYYYNDLTTVTVESFEACLEACDTYVPSPNVARGARCIAITWGPRTTGGECYRKFNITDSRFDRREDSAYKVGQPIVPPPASTIVNTNVASSELAPSTSTSVIVRSSTNSQGSVIVYSSTSTAVVVPTTRATTPSSSIAPATSTSVIIRSSTNSQGSVIVYSSTSTAVVVPTTRATTPTTSNPGLPATLISSSATLSSINPTIAFQPCPSSNGQQFIDQLGTVYDISCGCDFQYGDLSGAPHYDYFQDCILACDRYVPDPNVARGAPCIGVSWGFGNPGGNCYLKYTIPQVRCGYPAFCAAKKHDYTIPDGLISTSRTFAPTSTASVVPVPSSSSNAGNIGSTTSPPASSSPRGTTTSSPPPVVVPSSRTSSSPPIVVPSTTTSGSNPSNTFAPPQISNEVRCPAQNGSIYTDFFGQQWEIRCGQNIRGTNAKAVHADTFEKCLEFCDILGSVVGVTYPNGGFDNPNVNSINCYPYNVFTEFTSGAVPNLVGARPLNVSTGNSFNQNPLCPGYDNETYNDALGRVYEVRCDHAYGGGTNLAPTITKTLEGCLTFCSTYNTCVGVTFTSYVDRSRVDNCFPKSVLGDVTYQAGNSSAQLLGR